MDEIYHRYLSDNISYVIKESSNGQKSRAEVLKTTVRRNSEKGDISGLSPKCGCISTHFIRGPMIDQIWQMASFLLSIFSDLSDGTAKISLFENFLKILFN